MDAVVASNNAKWVYESPINSDVEAKLRDGQVIIDTAAGVLGKDDPRPIQHDSLFPLFSVTKGVTAGMVHWLADKGKLKLDENVANFWPEFGRNGKEQIKVNHILNHTSGLHNALAGISEEDPTLFCDFDECIKRIAMVSPETKPGCEQFYHYLSIGSLCGGMIEHASGKKFQDVLEEAFIRPLNIEGELYIGIPPGVESRLATISLDTNKASRIGQHAERPERKRSGTASIPVPSLLTLNLISTFISLSNTLSVRRAILPAFNLHASARALACYYAALVDEIIRIQFYKMGILRIKATDGNVIGFRHSGLGGSTGYCDINNRFAISVTLNLASSGALTGEIIRFICSELDLPVPKDYAESRDFTGNPKIN
ncbi:beta-lactamase domain-containing protein 2-like protein [Tanacetum coccineum]|uniref:Beta-lactamase domain-containing protein 2-like protein n=1 Tax=Tanacetum coccineum TaxID=301880 RepID=A0ABQ5DUC8_9ASTR